MGRNLYARLVAYKAAGDRIGVLPQPSSWQALVEFDESGSLTFDYAAGAVGGDITTRALTDGTEIAVEVSDGGEWTEPPSMRYLVIKREGDQTDPSGTVTFACVSYGWLLNKIRNLNTDAVQTDGDNKGQRPFLSANAGTIIKTFLQENSERGGAAANIDAGFDTGKDSSGTAWRRVQTLYYSTGVTLKTAMDSMVQGAVIDWDTQGRALRVWNADSTQRSRDLSQKVIVQLARDVTSGPFEETIEDTASHILVTGDNGLVFTEDNPATPSPWGKWESYVSQGGVSDEGTARAFMQATLEQASRVRGSYTRGLLVSDANHLPFIDYQPGDWITAPTVNHGEKVRVRQLKLSLDNTNGAQKITCSVTLNDALTDPDVRQNKKLNGISGGAALAGSESSRPAPAQDHRTPKAPEGLVLSSDAYLDSTGHARGLVSAVWGEVTQATDNTAIEIDSYRVEWRYSDEGDKWRSAGVTSDERLSWSNLDCGRTVVVRVRAIPTYSDRNGEWSGEKSVTVASDVTPPAVPSAPRLSSETGIVSISWDGLPATGTGMDADFDHCEVGRGLTSGSLAVVSASMTGRTQWIDTDVLPGAVWTYALRAVDHAGNKSAWSKTAQIEVVGAVSQDQIDQIQSDLAENEKTLAQAQKDIASNKQTIQQTNQTVEQVKSDVDDTKQTVAGVRQDLTQTNATLAQAHKDIQANQTAINQAQKDIAANEAAVSQAQKDVTATKATVDKVNSDLTTVKSDVSATKNTLSGVQSTLSQAQKDLEAAEQNISANTSKIAQAQSAASSAASKAQQAYDTATSAKKTADGLHNIFKGWQDPTTIEGTVVKTGDFWYRTQQCWTTSQGEPDNSPSLLANFYTYAEGEPDNSPSVLVPLESEVVEVLTWDGSQWNQFDLVASNVIASGSIIGDLIAANTITGDLIAANTITGDLIAANTINATHLTANSVTSEKIAANAVIADKIAANAVTTGKLDALAVTADKLAANAVTADKIAANAVTTGKLNALSVTAEKIAAGAVNADKLVANSVTADKIAANAISADKIAANAVTSAKIAAGAITADKLSANAVTAGKIAAEAVTTDKLAALSVTAGKIAALTITGDKIAANAISADKLAANAVTADKLAANSVNASKIVSGAITADKLAANSVTAVAIAAGTITTDKIKAGQFSGYVFTGAIYQSSTAENTGFKLRDAGLDMWDSSHNHTVHLDGNGGDNLLTGTFQTALSGRRVRISPDFTQHNVDDPGVSIVGSGIQLFLDGTAAAHPYIASESSVSGEGQVSAVVINGGRRDDDDPGAFLRVGERRASGGPYGSAIMRASQKYSDESSPSSYVEAKAHQGSGPTATIRAENGARRAGYYANGDQAYSYMYAGDSNGTIGVAADIDDGYLALGGYLEGLGSRATFQSTQWRMKTGSTPHNYAGETTWTFGTPAKYGTYVGVASADTDWAGIIIHPCRTNSASGMGVKVFNADIDTTVDIYAAALAWLRK